MKVRELLTSRHNVARVTRFLRAGGDVLDAVFKAQHTEGRLGQGLALASAVGTLLDVLVPDRPPHDQLLDMGYKPLKLGLGEFFCGMLERSELPRTQLQLDAATALVAWDLPDAQGAVAAVYRNEGHEAGPYVLEGRRELAIEALRSVVWQEERDLMLDTAGLRGRRSRPESVSYVLQPLKEPGVYFGVPGLQWFVDRLKRHEGETRSMLLVGPTGVGKSTLGRLISRETDGGKLVKVGARVLRNCAVTDLVEIAEFLQPDVLLLDDVSMITDNYNPGASGDGQMLELMEALHGKARLVIATLMLEPDMGGGRYGGRVRRYPGGSQLGTDYFDGMRPGRVDEVVRVKRPSPQIREKILVHYFGGEEGLAEYKVTQKLLKDMVKRTEGLTGAYLKEVVHRVKTHGTKTYKGEIKSVLEHAPRLSVPARHNAQGIRRRARRRRKTVWETRYEKAQLEKEALEAKVETLKLKLKGKGK